MTRLRRTPLHRPPCRGTGSAALVVSFLNTAACPACGVGDAFPSPSGCRAWLRSYLAVRCRAPSEAELGRLRRLRQALRDVVTAATNRRRPSVRALATMNAASRRFRPWATLTWKHGSWSLVHGGGTESPLDAALGELAHAATALLSGPENGKVRGCRGPACAHFPLARTRTHVWCSSTGCGNRVRAACHYRRTSSGRRGTAKWARGDATSGRVSRPRSGPKNLAASGKVSSGSARYPP